MTGYLVLGFGFGIILKSNGYLFYGISMLEKYKNTGKRKPYLIFALTALFLTVFIEQWLTSKKHAPALIGIGVSILCLVIFGSENFLIPSMLGIFVLLCLYKEDRKHD